MKLKFFVLITLSSLLVSCSHYPDHHAVEYKDENRIDKNDRKSWRLSNM